MPPAAHEKWNRRYAQATFEPFPDLPSEWLVENRDLLVPGRALDVACGDGRNSRYLAELGFAVDALDISDVAIEALRRAAQARGLTVAAHAVDLEAAPRPAGEFDLVINVNYLQRGLFAGLAAALAPGGLLVFETFSRADLPDQIDGRFLLEPNELLHAFPGLLVRRYREGIVERSGRPRGVASIVAQRLPPA